MRLAFLAAAALAASPLSTAEAQSLPGVEDNETHIPSGDVREFYRGHGDVLFVHHRTNRWYRVQVSPGCLNTLIGSDVLAFISDSPGGRIDLFSKVVLPSTGVTCEIKSIRRSEPPPQVDSQSPVTLD